ncbi:hypothetical protein [Nostoc sp. UHCC 0252]|uniref:hypothetical protein n=1 Tax=Nostoc sp. UHCC 0252 TaxID=3110241 RepID=UPI002B1EE9CF|nr:hypothetical protein [Nostoc sp. UHCC 0252]MEA5602681.1 hypothetical protein [Nostoc sp. UHCC 0252]
MFAFADISNQTKIFIVIASEAKQSQGLGLLLFETLRERFARNDILSLYQVFPKLGHLASHLSRLRVFAFPTEDNFFVTIVYIKVIKT